ncbi:hypothetical protein AHMF7616_02173 [Adhaeribacter pallidiroseus]|uniref:Gingipain domain-containing protein n=1 Tax=Adhaeribacter pallidiroseus TaxID=2072847 RepID=A0A369QMY8_9BACT|nr:hypothetical protein AHMF7616_02173 [Adhaeribacter pallidiroseus]
MHYARKNLFTSRSWFFSPADTTKTGDSYFVFQKNNNQTVLGYDVTNPYAISKITINNQATEASFVGPAPNNRQQKILLVNASNIYSPAAPVKTTFRNLANNRSNFILVYHSRLRKPAAAYPDPVKAYAEYRASTNGGKYDTLSLEIRQVYDQFHYGEKSAQAIKHLVNYLSTQGKPAYLLLLGQALLADYENFGRSRTAPSPTASLRDMIPTGYPASDIFLTADWEKIFIFRK